LDLASLESDPPQRPVCSEPEQVPTFLLRRHQHALPTARESQWKVLMPQGRWQQHGFLFNSNTIEGFKTFDRLAAMLKVLPLDPLTFLNKRILRRRCGVRHGRLSDCFRAASSGRTSHLDGHP
jgi:hypothetical protein